MSLDSSVESIRYSIHFFQKNLVKLKALLIVCIAFVIRPHDVHSQILSAGGTFEIDIDRGCTGLIVNVTELDTVNSQYWYEGDLNELGIPDLTYTYTEPGEFSLIRLPTTRSSDEVRSFGDSVLVTVIEAVVPEYVIHNCASHQVQVEITQDYYDSYLVEFTGTDAETIEPLTFSNTFNYGVQGSYRIDVTGQLDVGGGNCGTDNRVINTIDGITPPELTSVETVVNDPNNGAIQILHNLGDDIIYNLYASTDGIDNFEFSQIAMGTGSAPTAINTIDNFYCYYLDTYDACNNQTILSDTICSVLFEVEDATGGNRLSWLTETSLVNSYNILRNDAIYTTVDNPEVLTLLDTAVICLSQYIYNVQPIFSSGTSLGRDTAVIASQSGDLPAITTLPYSTINNSNDVELTWGPPDTGEIPFSSYIIQKSIDGRGWLEAGRSEDTLYTDLNASLFRRHSYRITYDDECDNVAAPSPSTDPMIIRQTSARGRIVSYSWNKYETWLDGIRSYTLQRVDSTGNVLEEFPILSGRQGEIEFSGDDTEDKWVRVEAESLASTPEYTYSNTILTFLELEMYLPTAFTPDNDNINDRFFAKGPVVQNFKMEIYNRWGVLIFSTDDNINGWDGTIDGQDSPEGTYIYKIFYEDTDGTKFDQSGAVVLMRKAGQ